MDRQSPVRIVVDTGERRSPVPQILRNLGVEVVEQHLPVGDYILSPRVGVERKSAADFVAALVKKRFEPQVTRLREAFERPLYLIEGRDLYGVRNVHPNYVRAALATIAVTHAVPVLFTAGAQDTAETLLLIARREQARAQATGTVAESKVIYLPAARKRLAAMHEKQIAVLQSIDGIGPQRARQLLERFRSLEAIARASPADLVEVPGIGFLTARRIVAILSAEYLRPEQT